MSPTSYLAALPRDDDTILTQIRPRVNRVSADNCETRGWRRRASVRLAPWRAHLPRFPVMRPKGTFVEVPPDSIIKVNVVMPVSMAGKPGLPVVLKATL